MHAQALISQSALAHNLSQVRELIGNRQVIAMVKADAYGHRLEYIQPILDGADLLAVSEISEVKKLRQLSQKSILLLSGVFSDKDIDEIAPLNCQVVIHSLSQLPVLTRTRTPLKVWIKIDTGMHRLGIAPEDFSQVQSTLSACEHISIAGVMSHFACADETAHPLNTLQLERFNALQTACARSMANSAAILSNPSALFDYVRPGIMLYGASPFNLPNPTLKPVMRLQAPVMAIRTLAAGEHVGYGARFTAKQTTTLATIGIGYGDGYPRHMTDGTPVSIAGKLCHLAGRVSMDMITVDVGQHAVQIGDMATLWGDEHTPVEVISEHAGTTAYELLTRVSRRVRFEDCP